MKTQTGHSFLISMQIKKCKKSPLRVFLLRNKINNNNNNNNNLLISIALFTYNDQKRITLHKIFIISNKILKINVDIKQLIVSMH